MSEGLEGLPLTLNGGRILPEGCQQCDPQVPEPISWSFSPLQVLSYPWS